MDSILTPDFLSPKVKYVAGAIQSDVGARVRDSARFEGASIWLPGDRPQPSRMNVPPKPCERLQFAPSVP